MGEFFEVFYLQGYICHHKSIQKALCHNPVWQLKASSSASSLDGSALPEEVKDCATTQFDNQKPVAHCKTLCSNAGVSGSFNNRPVLQLWSTHKQATAIIYSAQTNAVKQFQRMLQSPW
jgi:hypothetical protein